MSTLKSAQIQDVMMSGLSLREAVIARPVCGIYFLCRWSKVIYVGQSVDILGRLWGHESQSVRWFDSCFYFECQESELNDREQFWINSLRPPTNNIGCVRREIKAAAMEIHAADRSLTPMAVSKAVAKSTGFDIDTVLLALEVYPDRLGARSRPDTGINSEELSLCWANPNI